MSQSLFAITQELRQELDNAFDPDTGEALPAFEEKRALWGSKASAVTAYLLNLEAEIKVSKEHVERVKANIIGPGEAKIRRLKSYLMENMAASGITEIKAVDGSFVAKLYPNRDEAVEVFDEAQIPQDYLRVKTEPDKTLIKRAVHDGYEVPGARVVKRDRLQIK